MEPMSMRGAWFGFGFGLGLGFGLGSGFGLDVHARRRVRGPAGEGVDGRGGEPERDQHEREEQHHLLLVAEPGQRRLAPEEEVAVHLHARRVLPPHEADAEAEPQEPEQ